MRVRSAFSTVPATPCSNENYGETEDYNVMVVANPNNPGLTVQPVTICAGQTAALSATGGGLIKWYISQTAASFVGIGPNFTTPILDTTTTYWVQTVINGCPSPRIPVTVTVNPPFSVTPTASVSTVCAGEDVTLTGPSGYASYTWAPAGVFANNTSNPATATYGFGFISGSTTTAGDGVSTTADAVLSKLATAGTTRAYLYVGVRNAANGATTADESLTATVTGVGLVCLSDGTTCGKSLGPISTTAGDYEFELAGDGTGGTSTIKVTGSVTGASYTKSMTYYAAAAKTLTASVMTPVLAIGSNDSALSVTAVDAAGSTWGGTAYIVASAAADATAVGGSATTPVACVYSSSKALHYCPISAVAAGTGKFKVIDAATVALATATSNEVSVTSSVATPASVKISFNKASYAPGETGYILITPLDAAGKALPAAATASVLASGGITSNVGLIYNAATVTLTGTTVTTAAYSGTTATAGSQQIMFNAPLSGGSISLTAKGGTGLPAAGQVAISASATVTNDAAAALAAVTALATTVASLKTLITTLTNLVLKIQKKVKA
jgi:hypothetical protein